jgi:hypothetical protein
MKVLILMSIAGNEDPLYDLPHFSFSPGDIVELDDDLASAWIDSGIAGDPPASKAPLTLSAKAEAAAKAKAKAKSDDDADAAASRKAAIAELLAKCPQPEAVAQIEEARISGSPMHLVAAAIAEKFKEGE